MTDKIEKYINSKPPFSAEILIRQESHTITPVRDNGYNGNPIPVEGGVMLNVKLSSDTLQGLISKIQGHVALIE